MCHTSAIQFEHGVIQPVNMMGGASAFGGTWTSNSQDNMPMSGMCGMQADNPFDQALIQCSTHSAVESTNDLGSLFMGMGGAPSSFCTYL